MEKEIEVLHIKNDLNGGAALVTYQFAKRLIGRCRYNWLLTDSAEEFDKGGNNLEKSFTSIGGDIYRVPPVRGFLKRMIYYYHFFRANHINIAHFDTDNPARWRLVLVAKLAGVHRRIVHSHSTMSENKLTSTNSKILLAIRRTLICLFSTDYLACSKDAGIYMFGEKGVNSKRFLIVKNGTDIAEYAYSPERRLIVRKEQNIPENAHIIGFVGRMVEVKNLPFLMEIFEEYHIIDRNSYLWIVGDGPEREKIEAIILQKNLQPFVKLWGMRKDVSYLLQAMDVLLLPSLFEGFPMVAVEAQASGLPVFASTGVPEEARLTNGFYFYSLEKSALQWAVAIEDCLSQHIRSDCSNKIRELGYDINDSSERMYELYKNGCC